MRVRAEKKNSGRERIAHQGVDVESEHRGRSKFEQPEAPLRFLSSRAATNAVSNFHHAEWKFPARSS